MERKYQVLSESCRWHSPLLNKALSCTSSQPQRIIAFCNPDHADPRFRGIFARQVCRAEDDHGTWWFTAPDGKPFLSIGVNHAEPAFWRAQGDGQFMLKTYGPEFLLPRMAKSMMPPRRERMGKRVAINRNVMGVQ